MEGEGEGQQGGQEHHRPIVAQAVVHQQTGEARHPRPAPHQYDAPGVEHIDGRRPPPEGGSGGQLQGGQPQEQKAHAQGEGEVEGVEPGQVKVLDQQALRRQQNQGGQQAGPIEARPVPPGPLGQPAPQQQEDGGGEQAVSGVVEAEEHPLIGRPQGRQGGGEAVPAVPQQAHQIEEHRGQPGPLPQSPYQGAHDAGPQGQGGEVPQVIEGAVEEDVPQQRSPAVLERVVVEVQGQVEQGGQEIEQQGLLQKGPQGRRPLPTEARHQEPAADGEEEGDGDPPPDVGEQVVGQGAHRQQGPGVDGHHQQGGGEAEAVEAPQSVSHHPASLHTVSTTPPSLVSDIWQGRLAGNSSSDA